MTRGGRRARREVSRGVLEALRRGPHRDRDRAELGLSVAAVKTRAFRGRQAAIAAVADLDQSGSALVVEEPAARAEPQRRIRRVEEAEVVRSGAGGRVSR